MKKLLLLPVLALIFCHIFSAKSYAVTYSVSSGSGLVSTINAIISSASLTDVINITTASDLSVTSMPNTVSGRTLTINGYPGGSVISMGGTSGFLNVSNSSMSFNTLTISSASRDSSGAALNMTNSTATFIGATTFNYNRIPYNNTASYYGGAIYADRTNITFSSAATFTSNGAVRGGAIYGTNATINFNGAANFISNTNSNTYYSGYGGGLYLLDSSRVNFKSSAEFRSNSINYNGGGFYISGSTATFSGSTNFILNSANYYGGGFYATGSSYLRFDSTVNFTSNTTSSYYGGGFYATDSNVIFNSNANFQYNRASTDRGGAFYGAGSSNITFNGITNITSNTASYSGGGFHFAGSSLNFNNTTNIINNKNTNSSYSGGGFYTTSQVNFARKATIASNTAAGSGGGFYSTSSNGRVVFSSAAEIRSNKADMDGGGFYAVSSSSVSVALQAAVTENTAGGSGGGFYADAGRIYFSSSLVLTDNIAGSSGGGFYANSSTVSVRGAAKIENNISSGFGGGFYAAGGGRITFGNSVRIYNNTAGYGGGFAVRKGGAIVLSGSNLTVTENEALYFGGGAYLEEQKTTFSGNSNISNNTAGVGGGGLYIGSGSDISFSDISVFQNNTASAGGAIFLADSKLMIENARFYDNTAYALGGAVLLQGSGASNLAELTINTLEDSVSNFQYNTAGGMSNALHIGNYSKAVFNTDSGGKVEMYDGITSGNTSSAFITSGAGKFNLYADANLNTFENYGNFYILDGAIVRASGKITNEENALINMADGSISRVYAGSFKNVGALAVDVFNNETNDQIIVSGNVELNKSSSSLTANVADITDNNFRSKIFYLIGYGSLTGNFSTYTVTGLDSGLGINVQMSYGSDSDKWIALVLQGKVKGTSFSGIDGLSFNQSETARVLDTMSAKFDVQGSTFAAGGMNDLEDDLKVIIATIENLPNDTEKKKALSAISGQFISNALAAPAMVSQSKAIYDKIIPSYSDKKDNGNIWLQYSFSEQNLKTDDKYFADYSDSVNGITAGYDKIVNEKRDIMLGLFVQYLMHDVKEDKSTADVKSTGGGVYGGVMKERFEIKALLEAGINQFETKRHISISPQERTSEGEFDAFGVGADIEFAYKTKTGGDKTIKPYVGFEAKMINYSAFDESGADSLSLEVEGDSYMRSMARVGLTISDTKEKLNWYVGGEGKYLLAGEEPEVTSKLTGTDISFKSKGMKQDAVSLGIVAGAAYQITENISAFVNANAFMFENDSSFYGNLGAKYKFMPSLGEKAVKTEKVKKEKAVKQPVSDEEKARIKEEKRISKQLDKEAKAAKKKADAEAKAEAEAKAAAALAVPKTAGEINAEKEKIKSDKLLAKQLEKEAKESARKEKEYQKMLDDIEKQRIKELKAIEKEMMAAQDKKAKPEEKPKAEKKVKTEKTKPAKEPKVKAGKEPKQEAKPQPQADTQPQAVAEPKAGATVLPPSLVIDHKKLMEDRQKTIDENTSGGVMSQEEAIKEERRKFKEEAKMLEQERKRQEAEQKKAEAERKKMEKEAIKEYEESLKLQIAEQKKREKEEAEKLAEQKKQQLAELKKQLNEEEARIDAEEKEAKRASLAKKQAAAEEKARAEREKAEEKERYERDKQAAKEAREKAALEAKMSVSEEKARAEREKAEEKERLERDRQLAKEAKEKAASDAKLAEAEAKKAEEDRIRFEEERKQRDVQEKTRLEEEERARKAQIEAEIAAFEAGLTAAQREKDEKTKQEAERQARLKAEEDAKRQAEIAAHEAKLAQEKKLREEAEKQAVLEAKKKAEEDAKAAELAKKQADAEEKARIEKEKQAEKEAKAKAAEEARIEKEKLNAEIKLQKEAERIQKQKEKEELAAKKKAEKEEADRLKKEQEEAAERARQEVAERAAKEKAEKEAAERARQARLELLASSKGNFVFAQTNTFGSSDMTLSAAGRKEIKDAAGKIKEYLKANPGMNVKILVEGYTDSTGTDEDNKRVALRRAAVVANELADNDIDYMIIEPAGLGATEFKNEADTTSPENRRVEVRIIEEPSETAQ